MTFKSLGLSDALLKAILKKGYETPSAIQEKAIPLIFEQKDVLASAQTGSGKTAGFALPIIHELTQTSPKKKRAIRALILTPTRELAAQVEEEIRDYKEFTKLRSAVIFGGVGYQPQTQKLRKGVDILVATPGRLLDLHTQRKLSLAQVEMFVLDEADRMLDMGFLKDIKRILALMPDQRQNLLFSATFSSEIKKLARSFMTEPVIIEASPENTTVENIDQRVLRVDRDKKTELIIKLISEDNWDQALIFTRTKHGADRLSRNLEKAKISSVAIHGNKSQTARTKALSGFKKGKVQVLVGTDIAARGLDIPLLPHVVNFELPNVPEDYVHRIGRTGRAGASGEALSLVSLHEMEDLKKIERLIGEELRAETMSEFEPTETMDQVRSSKKQRGRNRGRGRNQKPRNRSNRKFTSKKRNSQRASNR